MSRTHHQEPTWVLLLRHGVPSHSHERGGCDLEQHREYLRSHGSNNGPHYYSGQHAGCSKVIGTYYVTCWHSPRRGLMELFHGSVKGESAPGGRGVQSMGDSFSHPSRNPAMRLYYDCGAGEQIRSTDEPLASLGEVPPCYASSGSSYAASSFNEDAPEGFSLRHYGFSDMEKTGENEYCHYYYLQVMDVDIPCSCDGCRPGYAFSCSLELPPSLERLAHKPRHCGCWFCDRGDEEIEKRGVRRATKRDLDSMRHAFNSGYDLDELE